MLVCKWLQWRRERPREERGKNVFSLLLVSCLVFFLIHVNLVCSSSFPPPYDTVFFVNSLSPCNFFGIQALNIALSSELPPFRLGNWFSLSPSIILLEGTSVSLVPTAINIFPPRKCSIRERAKAREGGTIIEKHTVKSLLIRIGRGRKTTQGENWNTR